MAATRRTTIFAKHPLPGAAKTRLCPPLTARGAAELARAMLDDTVALTRADEAFVTQLAVAPEDAVPWFAERYPGLPVVPQVGAGLGERLAAHFDAELAPGGGPRTAVVVGSDAPHLGTARIRAAHAALERGAELVLAPDEGGGYHLVGLARPVPELFTRVAMSTADMCARTLDLARSLGLRVEQLDLGFDVDTPDDLQRLARLAREAPHLIPTTARTLARLVPDLQPR